MSFDYPSLEGSSLKGEGTSESLKSMVAVFGKGLLMVEIGDTEDWANVLWKPQNSKSPHKQLKSV